MKCLNWEIMLLDHEVAILFEVCQYLRLFLEEVQSCKLAEIITKGEKVMGAHE